MPLSPLIADGQCFEFRGRKDRDGYGLVDVGKTTAPAHKLAYMLFVSDVPPGLCVLHNCDNPSCIRPDHLRLGTKADNARDCVERGRRPRKLTTEQVLEIKRRAAAGERVRPSAWGREFGVDKNTIKGILTRRLYRLVK